MTESDRIARASAPSAPISREFIEPMIDEPNAY
jgi:hypothetical protein